MMMVVALTGTAHAQTAAEQKGTPTYVYERQLAQEASWSLSADYNSSAHRGGAWGYGAQFACPLGRKWEAILHGRLFPNAENSSHDEEVLWQIAARLEYQVWTSSTNITPAARTKDEPDDPSEGDSEILLFVGVAGPSLVSQSGVDLEAGVFSNFSLADDLTLFLTLGANYTTVSLYYTRDAFAFGDVELAYDTGWLPNQSDTWFISLYAESGEIRGQGEFVQASGGVRFSLHQGVDIELRVGTEIGSPYYKREDLFLQAGVTIGF